MTRRFFNANDINQAVVNNQDFITGTSGENLNDESAYFVLKVFGTNVTLKDKDDNVIAIVKSDTDFSYPFLRFDGGFKFTASATATVFYAKVL